SKGRILPCVMKSAIMAMVLAGCSVAHAGEYAWTNFSNTNNLTINGNAFVTNTVDGAVMRVVPARLGQSGSFFATLPVRASTFSSSFKFRITNPGGATDSAGETGADGLTFVVQPITNSIGGGGGGIG